MLYGGVIALIYGIITYVPPAGVWPEGKKFPVAPAVQCTMILACQYFCVYGGIQVARTWTQSTGIRKSGPRIASSCAHMPSLPRLSAQLPCPWYYKVKPRLASVRATWNTLLKTRCWVQFLQ